MFVIVEVNTIESKQGFFLQFTDIKTPRFKEGKQKKKIYTGSKRNSSLPSSVLVSAANTHVSKLENLPFESDIYESVNCFVVLAC
jgi:hypothetical protein